MSRSFPVFLLVILALAALIASQVLFVVDERQRAVVLRFGEVTHDNVLPGLHIKVPFADQVIKFDSRVQTLDARPEEYLTKEKKALVVDTYVKWKIDKVPVFYTATNGNVSNAERLIAARVNTGLRNQYGERTVNEVISGDRDLAMSELTTALDTTIRRELGVRIIDVRVRKLNLPETVSRSVYERMISERERLARELRSEGREKSEAIRAKADKQKLIIESDAYRQSEILRGKGDALAAQTYADAYSQNSDFFELYRSLKAYEATFKDKSDIFVVAPDSEFFSFMKQIKKYGYAQ